MGYLSNAYRYYRDENQICRRESHFKCIAHAAKLSEWAWDTNTPNRLFDDYINRIGLHVLKRISHSWANRIVISHLWNSDNPKRIPFICRSVK